MLVFPSLFLNIFHDSIRFAKVASVVRCASRAREPSCVLQRAFSRLNFPSRKVFLLLVAFKISRRAAVDIRRSTTGSAEGAPSKKGSTGDTLDFLQPFVPCLYFHFTSIFLNAGTLLLPPSTELKRPCEVKRKEFSASLKAMAAPLGRYLPPLLNRERGESLPLLLRQVGH
ncbi:Hypothetical protein NTJ_07036 [Nesidiocoris tenuis]|uniref:Transmembrane protein n=1 Tax=Nesidiocoris tenuis TaxID=355587 RepID=A0ABN7APT6_9HEMI|nr:Hypothetical protein NTJ_07036 [Nesidiocoris tenuis]